MPEGRDANSLMRAHRALDAANFFLADVRDGLGPYLAVYLLTEQKWDEARIGLVMSIATIAGIVAQTPARRAGRCNQSKTMGDGRCIACRHHRISLAALVSELRSGRDLARSRARRRGGVSAGNCGDLARHCWSPALCGADRA